MSRRFLNDVSWFSVAQFVVGVTMLAYMMVAARVLGGGSDMTTYGLFQSIMGLYNILFVLGFPLSVATVHMVGAARLEDRPAALGSCLSLAMVVGGASSVVVLLVSPLLARMLRSDSVGPLVTMAVLLVVTYLLTVFYGALQGRNDYRRYAFTKVTETALSFVAGTVLMLLGCGVSGAVGGYLGGMGLVTLAFLMRVGDYRLRFRVGPLRRELQSVMLPLAVSAVLFFALAGPMLVARWRLDETTSGVYAALFSFRNVLQPFALAVSLPLYSRIVAGQGEKGMLGKALAVVTFLAGGFFVVSLICPAFCVRVLLGAKFLPAAGYLWFYALALGLFMVGMVVMFHAAARRELKLFLLPIPVAGVAAMAVWPELTIGKIIGLQVAAWLTFLLTQTTASLWAAARTPGDGNSSALGNNDLGDAV